MNYATAYESAQKLAADLQYALSTASGVEALILLPLIVQAAKLGQAIKALDNATRGE